MCGVQAQDLRSAALALRSRVPGLTRAAVRDAGLVRTWTVRGTLHLIAPEDRAWLHALCAPRFLPRMERALEQRGHADTARAMLADLLELIGDRPYERADAAGGAGRARPSGADRRRGERAAAVGGAAGPGRGHGGRPLGSAAEPPEPVDDEVALATRGDATWRVTVRLTRARPGGVVGPAARGGRAARSSSRAPSSRRTPAEPPECVLLAAFDTAMLGWASRAWIVPAEHDREVLPGEGVLRAVVLAGECIVGTWRGDAEITWFGPGTN